MGNKQLNIYFDLVDITQLVEPLLKIVDAVGVQLVWGISCIILESATDRCL